jgi:two-component system alkaline phosphatase synthesis response regulator PhoP
MSSKTCILIIDDHERTVKAIQRILQKEGYEVLTALDGATGLKKAREEKPDLIILDIVMPGMNGYEVCYHLQRREDTAGIAVLMLTGKGQIDYNSPGVRYRIKEREAGFDVGALEFLNKPVRAKELVKRVKGLLWVRGFEG